MLRPHDPNRPPRRRLIAGVVLALAALAVVAVSLSLNSSQSAAPAPRAHVQAQPVPSFASSPLEVSTRPARVDRSDDPAVFAREVAHDLFTWDTTTPVPHSFYTGRILEVTAAEESAGLASDLGNYLPNTAIWPSLREYRTRQWLEVTSLAVPDLWAKAVAEAGPDGLLPGTSAYTVEGVRHRAGIWEGAPVTTAHEVSFTVFVVCAPTYPTCHLLRLSLPDKPLK